MCGRGATHEGVEASGDLSDYGDLVSRVMQALGDHGRDDEQEQRGGRCARQEQLVPDTAHTHPYTSIRTAQHTSSSTAATARDIEGIGEVVVKLI